MLRTLRSCYKFSKYLQALYQKSKFTQTPFFTINSHSIQIIQDPLDFYALLCGSIANASQRIGLSCLYLSTGPLERHLLAKIGYRHKLCPAMQSAFVFDFHRSSRQQHGQSPMQMINNWAEGVGPQASVAFKKIGSGKGVVGEVLGVHHQKIYLFDDRVVLSGANLSKNYFLNRKDRVLSIQSPELADYLFQYLQILAENPNSQQLQTRYKLWKYAHMPAQYCETFTEQIKYLNNIVAEKNSERERTFLWQKAEKSVIFSRNAEIAKSIGTSITQHEPMPAAQLKHKRETVRDRLFGVKSQDYVGNQIQELGQGFWNTPMKAGKDIYLFPFIQWSVVNELQQYKLFSELLRLAAQQNHKIQLTSGYLNLDQSLFSEVAKKSKLQNVFELLCSAPEANSFYRAGGFRSLVPYMYRCYEYNLLKQLGNKVQIKQFCDGRWSYHAKGVWIDEAENSLMTIVGSSNFNERSRFRDSQFQFYIYSGCEDLNGRFRMEWKNMERYCKVVDLDHIERDEDVKIRWFHRLLARTASGIL